MIMPQILDSNSLAPCQGCLKITYEPVRWRPGIMTGIILKLFPNICTAKETYFSAFGGRRAGLSEKAWGRVIFRVWSLSGFLLPRTGKSWRRRWRGTRRGISTAGPPRPSHFELENKQQPGPKATAHLTGQPLYRRMCRGKSLRGRESERDTETETESKIDRSVQDLILH